MSLPKDVHPHPAFCPLNFPTISPPSLLTLCRAPRSRWNELPAFCCVLSAPDNCLLFPAACWRNPDGPAPDNQLRAEVLPFPAPAGKAMGIQQRAVQCSQLTPWTFIQVWHLGFTGEAAQSLRKSVIWLFLSLQVQSLLITSSHWMPPNSIGMHFNYRCFLCWWAVAAVFDL